jgi:hypothetical protein
MLMSEEGGLFVGYEYVSKRAASRVGWRSLVEVSGGGLWWRSLVEVSSEGLILLLGLSYYGPVIIPGHCSARSCLEIVLVIWAGIKTETIKECEVPAGRNMTQEMQGSSSSRHENRNTQMPSSFRGQTLAPAPSDNPERNRHLVIRSPPHTASRHHHQQGRNQDAS